MEPGRRVSRRYSCSAPRASLAIQSAGVAPSLAVTRHSRADLAPGNRPSPSARKGDASRLRPAGDCRSICLRWTRRLQPRGALFAGSLRDDVVQQRWAIDYPRAVVDVLSLC